LARRLLITSPSNARLKAVRRLGHARSSELILVEGGRAIRAALAGAVRVRELYVAPELFLGSDDAPLIAGAERCGVRVLEVGADAFRTLSPHRRPDGLLALAERPATALARLALSAAPFVVVAAGIERPGNLGTIVRTACAAGTDALVVVDPCTDVFHPDVVRASVGTVFQVPLALTTTARAIAWLREREIGIVATTPAGSTPHRAARYTGSIAVVLGSERYGLSAAWLDAADEHVAIAMRGSADSLNVAVAAGVVLFEAAARRDG
jgi:RNA methyltransferase, TrmH family